MQTATENHFEHYHQAHHYKHWSLRQERNIYNNTSSTNCNRKKRRRSSQEEDEQETKRSGRNNINISTATEGSQQGKCRGEEAEERLYVPVKEWQEERKKHAEELSQSSDWIKDKLNIIQQQNTRVEEQNNKIIAMLSQLLYGNSSQQM